MSRAKTWCFTINNPEGTPLWAAIPDLNYVVWQHETGEEGTPHFQGFMQFTKVKRLTWLKNNVHDTAHFESARNIQHSVAYCQKDDTRTPVTDTWPDSGPWEFGELRGGQGTRNDLSEIKRKLDEGAKMSTIAEEHFGQFLRYNKGFKEYKRLKTPKRNWTPDILVFWGPTGTGKTTEAYLFDPELYRVPNRKGSGIYFDDYDDHDTILFDEFGGSTVSYTFLKQLLDSREMVLPVHGGAGHQLIAHTIIFTSNYPPWMWYKESNRNVGPWDNSPLKRRLDDWGTVLYLGRDTPEEDYLAQINPAPLVPDQAGVLFAPNFNN